MNRFSIILAILLLLSGISAHAQIKVEGRITDAVSEEPLPGSVIYACNNTAIVSYTTSKADGNYLLNTTGQITHLRVYHLGYKQVQINIGEKSNCRADIKLEEESYSLKSITIKPAAIKIEGDTVKYDAEAFSRREDKSLGEVLGRLPDVEVTTSGSVKIKGVSINKLYIEEMDLLGGRYGIAVNNLRADDIAYISVYNNHQPVKALKEIELTNQAALNITLKEKAKNRWILSFMAASGAPELLYSGKINAMNFNKKSQTIITAKSDNSGNNIIKETTIQNLKPGHYSLSELEGTMDNLFAIGRPMLPIPPEYYYFNKSNALTYSRLNKLKNNAELKGNIVFTTESLKDETFTEQIINPLDGSEIKISDSTYSKRSNTGINGEFTYTLNESNRFVENIFSFKVHPDNARNRISGESMQYNQKYSLPKFMLKNSLQYIKTANRKTFRLHNFTEYSELDQRMTVVSDKPNPVFGTGEAVQNIFSRNFGTNTYMSFSKRTPRSIFTFRPGAEIIYRDFKSYTTPTADSVHNGLHLFTVQPYMDFSLSYEYRKLKTNVSVPLKGRWNILNNSSSMYLLYNPSLNISYDICNGLKMYASVSGGNNVGDISTMAKGYIYTSYRNMVSYEKILKNRHLNCSMNIGYESFSSFWFINATVSYRREKSNMVPWYLYEDDYTVTIYSSLANILAETFDTRLGIKKIIGINKCIVNGDVSYGTNSTGQYLQGEMYKYKTYRYGAGIGFEYSFSESAVIKYRADYSKNEFESKANKGKTNFIEHFTNNISIITYPFKNMQLSGSFYHFLQKSTNYTTINMPFLNIKAEYKINSKCNLSLRCNNLLNTKNYTSSHYGAASIINKNIRLRGAEYLAGISVEL